MLPNRSQCTLKFLQQLLSGAKLGLTEQIVTNHETPRHPEFSVPKLWLLIKADHGLTRYLPDCPVKVMPDGSRVDRPYETNKKFLWDVIANLRPDFASRIIREANEARLQVSAAELD